MSIQEFNRKYNSPTFKIDDKIQVVIRGDRLNGKIGKVKNVVGDEVWVVLHRQKTTYIFKRTELQKI